MPEDAGLLNLADRGDIFHSISPSGTSDVSVVCPTGNCVFTGGMVIHGSVAQGQARVITDHFGTESWQRWSDGKR